MNTTLISVMDNFSTGSVNGVVEKVCANYTSAIDSTLPKLAILNLIWIWIYPLIKYWGSKGVNIVFRNFKINKNVVGIIDTLCYASILIINNFILYVYLSKQNINILLFLNSIKGYIILVIVLLLIGNYYFNNKEKIHKMFKETEK